jgi:branched-chain amino acid transport system substrate-binding protein
MRFLPWIRAVIAVVVVLLAAACTSSDQEEGGTSSVGEVKIGVLVPSGKAAGVEALRGAELAAALVNGEEGSVPLLRITTGGLRGLGGAKLTVVEADTKSEPARGSAEAVRLITQERAVGLVGAYDSGVTAEASQRTERLGIPFVNGDSSTGYLTERGLDWFFRTGPTDRMLGEAFLSTLKEQQAGRSQTGRIAIIYAKDELGNGLHAVITQLAAEGGYDIVPSNQNGPGGVGFESGTPDLTAAVAQVRAARPDAVFLVASSPTDASRVLDAFGRLGYTPPGIFTFGAGFLDQNVLNAAGPNGEGLLFSAAWSREVAGRNPAAKPIMDLYEERFNAPMGEVAAGSFTAVLTVATAIDNAGSVEPQRVRAALISLDLPGRSTIMPWSGVRFDASHQNSRASGTVEQRVQGSLRVVFPSEIAQASAIWPRPGANA